MPARMPAPSPAEGGAVGAANWGVETGRMRARACASRACAVAAVVQRLPRRRAPARGANPPVFASQPHAPRCDMRSSILSASVTQRRDGCLLSSPTKPTPAGGEGGAAAGRRGGCGSGAGCALLGQECPSACAGRQRASDVARGPPAAHQRPSSAAGGGCGCGIAVARRESGGPRGAPAAAAATDRRPCQPDSNTQRITANAHAPARGSEAVIGAARQVSGKIASPLPTHRSCPGRWLGRTAQPREAHPSGRAGGPGGGGAGTLRSRDVSEGGRHLQAPPTPAHCQARAMSALLRVARAQRGRRWRAPPQSGRVAPPESCTPW